MLWWATIKPWCVRELEVWQGDERGEREHVGRNGREVDHGSRTAKRGGGGEEMRESGREGVRLRECEAANGRIGKLHGGRDVSMRADVSVLLVQRYIQIRIGRARIEDDSTLFASSRGYVAA